MARATLVDPKTGERRAIETQSQEERDLFARGFVLDTGQNIPQQNQLPPTLPGSGGFTPPTREQVRTPFQGGLTTLEERLRQAQELQEGFLKRSETEEFETRQRIREEFPQAERIKTEQERLREELRNLFTAPTEETFADVQDPFARRRLREERSSSIERELANLGIIAAEEEVGRTGLVDRENAIFLAQMAQAELGVTSAEDALQALKDEFESQFQFEYNRAFDQFDAEEKRRETERTFEQNIQLGEIGFEQQKELARLDAALRPPTGRAALPGELGRAWGSSEATESGGLNFFDNEGDPVTADVFARSNNMSLVEVISASEDPADKEFVDAYNRGVQTIGQFDDQGVEITPERFESDLKRGFPLLFSNLTIG